jgi:hypothetical protein
MTVDDAGKPADESGEGAPERPVAGLTMEARVENVIAHVDPDRAPDPLFAPRTETGS